MLIASYKMGETYLVVVVTCFFLCSLKISKLFDTYPVSTTALTIGNSWQRRFPLPTGTQ